MGKWCVVCGVCIVHHTPKVVLGISCIYLLLGTGREQSKGEQSLYATHFSVSFF